MIHVNFLVLLIATCVPLIIGAIYYNPSLGGRFLIDKERTEKKHKPIVYIFSFVLSFMYSLALAYQVIHQLHFQSMFYNEVGFIAKEGSAFRDYEYIMATYGSCFRNFKHGMFHGFLNSLFIVLPILSILSVFEGKTWKYILTHWGYWALCGMIMGGIICEFY